MTAVIYVQIGFNKETFFVVGPYYFHEKTIILQKTLFFCLF